MNSEMLLIELYKEEQSHARHTEVQRSEVTKFILAIAGVFIAAMATLRFSIYCLPFGIVITALGYLGVRMTEIYVQRFDDHRKRARAFREKLDALATPAGIARQVLEKHRLAKDQRGRLRDLWKRVNQAVMLLGALSFAWNVVLVAGRFCHMGKLCAAVSSLYPTN